MYRGRSRPGNTRTDNTKPCRSISPKRTTFAPISGSSVRVSHNVIMHFGRKFRPYSLLMISIVLAIILVSSTSRSVKGSAKTLNYRPIVGILTQASPSSVLEYGKTYLPATYVQFIESAGARVVPVFVNQSTEYYKDLFNSINGGNITVIPVCCKEFAINETRLLTAGLTVQDLATAPIQVDCQQHVNKITVSTNKLLWPGGGLDDLLESGYGRAGKILYELAIKSNQNGDYFPIWGTCQGFELMVSLAAGKNVLTTLKSFDQNLNVTFSKDYFNSKLMSGASEEVLVALRSKAVTYNGHEFSLTPTNYSKNAGLRSAYHVVATSTNDEGKEFVALLEAKDYPFYGVQFHPEKPLFTWSRKTSVKHDPTTIMVSQYFANFFVNEARLSGHTFANAKTEEDTLIYNHKLVYLRGKQNLDQAYFFN